MEGIGAQASKEAQPSLVYPGADGRARVHALQLGSTTIGRARDNDVILDDAKVADHHAVVMREGQKISLRDLLSGGRTFVNEAPLKEGELRPGDVLRIGETRMRLAFVQNPPKSGRLSRDELGGHAPSGSSGTTRALGADPAEMKRLREHDARRLKALARTRQLSDEIPLVTDIEDLLAKVALALIEIFDAERSVCLLLEEDGLNPLLTVERRRDGSEEGSGVAKEIVDRCTKSRTVVKIASPPLAGGRAANDARGFASALIVGGKALGVLLHERATDAPSLEVEDLHLTAIVTNQVAQAVAKLLA